MSGDPGLAPPPVPPPVVAVPLRAERLALLGALPGRHVLRTGMGAGGHVRGPRPGVRDRAAALLVAGLAGAVAPGLRPGDVVVATRVRAEGRRAEEPTAGSDRGLPASVSSVPVPSAPLLAAALRRLGLRVHLGPVVSAGGVVSGAARRARLAATGALAVDMESAALAPPGRPFAVVRVIVDTPRHPLRAPGTLVRGTAALRVLRRAAPALEQWLSATGPREVLLTGAEAPDPPGETDLVLVAGRAGSPMGRRLVEAARRAGRPAHLVDEVTDVDLRWLAGVRRVTVAADALAPPHLVEALVDALAGLGPVAARRTRAADQDIRLTQPQEVR